MGICISAEAKAEKDRSLDIDKMIEKDEKQMKSEYKLLLLGSGESGKSTVVKQIKIIHQHGYTKPELYSWRPTIYQNVLESALALVRAMKKFSCPFAADITITHVDFILDYCAQDPIELLDQALVQAIQGVWQDTATAAWLERQGSQFYLMDSASYFFDHIQRIGDTHYIPVEQDVVRARSKTTGISETHFTLKDARIHLFDVGGQRSERKKWIHCFEAVTCIIFCVSLSEYDQVLLEEGRQNRMLESLVLFESVVNSRWFLRSSVVLFLNKIDIFKKKLPVVPLENYFPDYGGGADVNKAVKYIIWRFGQTNRARLAIYPHITEATNTQNIRTVFEAVKQTVLRNSLIDCGLL
ncbi:heterotrimeric G protein alpha subunit [Hesseltinella vesiculosa]|uniref:Heterotrimeric G protein alpha subunit n=1 Tax=Hesseltinella vesiculosa TaxID=101127 RepID=A0A1X2G9B3_9FUNG|nr:heterotrimeric G protein alpha subunit [Hesseltinella vesiculosa]